jgi:hypothetical protein
VNPTGAELDHERHDETEIPVADHQRGDPQTGSERGGERQQDEQRQQEHP